ncbi:MAG: OmpA family protein [Granulosicoccaceae bacterium]
MTSRIDNRLRTCAALLVGAMIVVCLQALAFAGTSAVVAATSATAVAKFTPRLYIGGGFGASTLEPEDECPCIGVGDDSSSGHHLMIGYDLSRWLSAEVYFADLGAAEIEFLGTDVGPVDYSVAGVSAIAYLVNNQSGTLFNNNGRGMHRREGLSVYTRLGLGTIDNDTDLEYNRDYAVHLAVGLGAEYGFKNGFALRGEYTAFDSDVRYASISLLKRFGQVAQAAAPIAVAAVVPAVTPEPVQLEARQVGSTVAPFLYFGFDDTQLSSTAQEQLKAYAEELMQSDYSFVVEGHADWVGSEGYNQNLSERRADAVYRYLVAQGVPASRMGKKGYGESRPNNSNHTAAGRSQNRRVEFFIN